jgi:fructose-1,6-bisphosphatase/inositol monophosphatase family enzyme
LTATIDVDQLAGILREAADAEIMPRFRALSPDGIRRKTSAVDLVTEADETAERFIKTKVSAGPMSRSSSILSTVPRISQLE